MNDNPEYFEYLRRKKLAEISINSEISKTDAHAQPPPTNDKKINPSPRQLHKRFQHAVQDLNKPSLGMMFVGIMLTLTSVVLVSLCFVTTVDSYDMALYDTDHIHRPSLNNDNLNGGGGGYLGTQYFPIRPRITAYHFQRPHFPRINRFENRVG